MTSKNNEVGDYKMAVSHPRRKAASKKAAPKIKANTAKKEK